MANEFYITAGLIAQDNDVARGTNAFYVTAGLVANDFVPSGGLSISVADLLGNSEALD